MQTIHQIVSRLVLMCMALLLVIGSVALIAPIDTSHAQDQLTATTNAQLRVRSGPGTRFSRIAVLPQNTTVIVEGRNDNADWLLIRTQDNSVRGWVALGFVTLSREVRITDLPIGVLQPAGAGGTTASGTPSAAGATAGTTGVNAAGTPIVILPERNDYPLLYYPSSVIGNVQAIFRRGKQRGNTANAFIKIGESNTAGNVYLCNFEWGSYNLGQYSTLQPTVDAFNTTKSFCTERVTATNGMSTSILLDPTFGCDGVNALQCEINRTKPAYAIIYMGIGDMGSITADQFERNMTRIVRTLSDNGVIPILTTYPMADWFADGNPQAFNLRIRAIAAAQRVPLMDVRHALIGFQNRGTGPDGFHLSYGDAFYMSFNGDEFIYGRTRRELMTLQMLTDLRNAVAGL
jgi:hypothetical protein